MAELKQTLPSIKFNYIDDIEATGAKKGFLKLVPQGIYTDAKYNNAGRFTFKENTIWVLNNDEPRKVAYSDYIKDPAKYPAIKTTKYGIIGLTTVVDFDTKQELTLFFGTNPKNTKALSVFAEIVSREISKTQPGSVVFEIGKEKRPGKTQPMFYIKAIGTVDDVNLLEDPTGSARRESLFENQEQPPAAPAIQNFVLNEDEKYVMDQINELVTTKNVEVTSDRLKTTFEKGFRGKATTPERAAYIATNAKALGFKGKLN